MFELRGATPGMRQASGSDPQPLQKRIPILICWAIYCFATRSNGPLPCLRPGKRTKRILSSISLSHTETLTATQWTSSNMHSELTARKVPKGAQHNRINLLNVARQALTSWRRRCRDGCYCQRGLGRRRHSLPSLSLQGGSAGCASGVSSRS